MTFDQECRLYAQGYRCGYAEFESVRDEQRGEYVLASHVAAAANTSDYISAKHWASGYRDGYRMALTGKPPLRALSEWPLPA